MGTPNDQWDNYGVPPLTRADRLLLQGVYRSTELAAPTKKINAKKPLPANYFDNYIRGTKSDYRLDYMMTERSIWSNILRSFDTPESQYDFKDFLDKSGLRGITEQSAAESIKSGVLPSTYALASLSAGSLSGILSFHKNEHLTYMRRMLTLSYQQTKTQAEISNTLKAIGVVLEKTANANGGFGHTMLSRIQEAFKRQTAAAIATSIRELSAQGIGWAGKELANLFDVKALMSGRYNSRLIGHRLNLLAGNALQKGAGLSNWAYGVTGLKLFNRAYHNLDKNKYVFTEWLNNASDPFYKWIDHKANSFAAWNYKSRPSLLMRGSKAVFKKLFNDYSTAFSEGIDGSAIRTEVVPAASITGSSTRRGVVDFEKKSLFYAEAQSNYLRDIRNLIAQGYGGGGLGISSKLPVNLPDYSNASYYNNKLKEEQDAQKALDEQKENLLKARFEQLKEKEPEWNLKQKKKEVLGNLTQWFRHRAAYWNSLEDKGAGIKGLWQQETKSRKLLDIGWKTLLGGGAVALSGFPAFLALPAALAYNTWMTGLHHERETTSSRNTSLRLGKAMANLAVNASMLPSFLGLPLSALTLYNTLTGKGEINRTQNWIEHLVYAYGLGDMIGVLGKTAGNLLGVGAVAALSRIHGGTFERKIQNIQNQLNDWENYGKIVNEFHALGGEKGLQSLKAQLKPLPKNHRLYKELASRIKILEHLESLGSITGDRIKNTDFGDTNNNRKLIRRAVLEWERHSSSLEEKIKSQDKEFTQQGGPFDPSYKPEKYEEAGNELKKILNDPKTSFNKEKMLDLFINNHAFRYYLEQSNNRHIKYLQRKNLVTEEDKKSLNKAWQNVRIAEDDVRKFLEKHGGDEDQLTPQEAEQYQHLLEKVDKATLAHNKIFKIRNFGMITALKNGYAHTWFDNRKRAKVQAKSDSVLNSIQMFKNDQAAFSEEEKQLNDVVRTGDIEAQRDISERLATGTSIQLSRANNVIDQIKDLQRKPLIWNKLSEKDRQVLIAKREEMESLLPGLRSQLQQHNKTIKDIDQSKPGFQDSTLSQIFSGQPSPITGSNQELIGTVGGGSPKIKAGKQVVEIHANVVNLYGKRVLPGSKVTGIETSHVEGNVIPFPVKKGIKQNALPMKKGSNLIPLQNPWTTSWSPHYGNPVTQYGQIASVMGATAVGDAAGTLIAKEIETKPDVTHGKGLPPATPEITGEGEPFGQNEFDISRNYLRKQGYSDSEIDKVLGIRQGRFQRTMGVLRDIAHGQTRPQRFVRKAGNVALGTSAGLGLGGVGAVLSGNPLLGSMMLTGAMTTGAIGLGARAISDPLLMSKLGLLGLSSYELTGDFLNRNAPHHHRLWNTLKQAAILGSLGYLHGGVKGALIGIGTAIAGANSDVTDKALRTGKSWTGDILHGVYRYGLTPIGHMMRGIYHVGTGLASGIWDANKGDIYSVGRFLKRVGHGIKEGALWSEQKLEKKADDISNWLSPIGLALYNHLWNHSVAQHASHWTGNRLSFLSHGVMNRVHSFENYLSNFNAHQFGHNLGSVLSLRNVLEAGTPLWWLGQAYEHSKPALLGLRMMAELHPWTEKARSILGSGRNILSSLGKVGPNAYSKFLEYYHSVPHLLTRYIPALEKIKEYPALLKPLSWANSLLNPIEHIKRLGRLSAFGAKLISGSLRFGGKAIGGIGKTIGKLGGGLLGHLGITKGLLGVALKRAGYLGDAWQLYDDWKDSTKVHKHRFWSTLGQMASFGASGAALGSFAGPVGTVIGGLLGAGLGLAGANSDIVRKRIIAGYKRLHNWHFHLPWAHRDKKFLKHLYDIQHGIPTHSAFYDATLGVHHWLYGAHPWLHSILHSPIDAAGFISHHLKSMYDWSSKNHPWVTTVIHRGLVNAIGPLAFVPSVYHHLTHWLPHFHHTSHPSVHHRSIPWSKLIGAGIQHGLVDSIGPLAFVPSVYHHLTHHWSSIKEAAILGTTPDLYRRLAEEKFITKGSVVIPNRLATKPEMVKYINQERKKGALIKTLKSGIEIIPPLGMAGPVLQSVLSLHQASHTLNSLLYGQDVHHPEQLKKLDKQVKAITKSKSGLVGALVKTDKAVNGSGGGWWNNFKSFVRGAIDTLTNGGSDGSGGSDDPISATANVNAGPAIPITGAQQKKNVMDGMKFLLGKGFCLNAAAAILGNFQGESGLNPHAVGDGGQAYGIAQWHPDRQANIAQHFGKSLGKMNFMQQLNAALWEMSTGYKVCWNALRVKGQHIRYYVWYLVNKYEMPLVKEPNVIKRTQFAEGVLAYYQANTKNANDDKKAGSATSSLVNGKLKSPHQVGSGPSSGGGNVVPISKGHQVPKTPISGGTGGFSPSDIIRHSNGMMAFHNSHPPLSIGETTQAVSRGMEKTNKHLIEISTSNKKQESHLAGIKDNTSVLKEMNDHLKVIADNSKKTGNITVNRGGDVIMHHSPTNTLSLKRVGATTGI